MSSTLQASVFIVKNYSDNLYSIKNTEDLTMKQMFDISEKLIAEQSDEIYGINTFNWEDSSWKYLSLVGDEEVISLLHTKVYVISDSVLCLGKMKENPQSNIAWEDILTWFKSSPEYRALDTIDGEPMEFEWNIFPGLTTLQLLQKFMNKMSDPDQFQGRIIFLSMFNDLSWGSKDNEKECESSAQLVYLYAKTIFSRTMVIPRTWIRKEIVFYSRIQSTRTMGQSCGADDVDICRRQTPSLPIHESIVQRSAQKQCGGKLSIHFCADGETVETVFRTIISVDQLSIYGAVSDMCEECGTCHDRTGRPVVARQSNPLFVPSVMKTHIPLTDDPAQEQDLWQRYQERIEKLSQQDRVIKFCTDVRFLTTVEVGQYFMTEDSQIQWTVVSTHCQEMKLI